MDITVNGRSWQVKDALADSPLLWVLRDELGLVGTKFGCGIGTCGACTIHVDGEAVRSCQTTPGEVIGHNVITIEGLAATASTGTLHPVQQAWIEHSVPQCGYCQAGQIMSAAALRAPDQVRTQIEGDLIWGLSMVKSEELSVEQGRLSADYLGDYQIPTIADAPTISIELIEPENTAPVGAGEAAIVASGAAIANAVAAFSGHPITELPIRL